MPYGIAQCYLPPDRGVNPAFTPSWSRYSISDPGGMQGWVYLWCYVKADRLGTESNQACQLQVQRPTAAPPRSNNKNYRDSLSAIVLKNVEARHCKFIDFTLVQTVTCLLMYSAERQLTRISYQTYCYPHMPIGKVWIYRLLFVCV